jgi:transcription termination/antitermination protein NusA
VVRIKYDVSVMQYISMFESLTGAKVKDCIVNGSIVFVIGEGEMGKAIGKQGSNVKRIESMMKKKIRLVEYSSDVTQFVQSLISPIKAKEIKEEEGVVNVYCADSKSKGMIIGRDKHNIKFITGVVKRFFDIGEIKVA